MQRVLLLVNKKVGEMEHYDVPLPPLEYGPAFTAGERVLKRYTQVQWSNYKHYNKAGAYSD